MERNEILAKAVIEQTKINSKFGAAEYDVCGLMTLGVNSLSELYAQVSDLRDKASRKTLLEKLNQKTITSDKLEFKLTLIEEVTKILIEKKAAEEKAKEMREDAQRKLKLRLDAKDVKEIERINSLSQDELDKEIAELKAIKE